MKMVTLGDETEQTVSGKYMVLFKTETGKSYIVRIIGLGTGVAAVLRYEYVNPPHSGKRMRCHFDKHQKVCMWDQLGPEIEQYLQERNRK